MNLNNNLYTILTADPEAASYTLELLPDCVIYRAHFPGHPITPGVCIIQVATELLSRQLGVELQLTEVVNAKFLSVINPEETPSVTYTFKKITLDEATATVKATATVSHADTIFTKLSLGFKTV